MSTATQKTDLPAQYDHQAAQEKWYAFWIQPHPPRYPHGYFHADVDAKDEDGNPKEPFTIVIPPPNVTGALHLGHALNNTLQDILIRIKRMQGFNTLWMPGTDHAGIATQAVVERRLLEEEKLSRHDLGREKLVQRIWDWKEIYEARILGQLKQLGCSCDWQRKQFTLDDQCARAVRETFFRLFKDRKIYRGKRLVNWDTFLQTAVSDDEVFHETVKGHFWHFKYPVIDPAPGEPDHVTIATTRPETMLGDTAVAVHPDPEAALDKTEAELKTKLAAAPQKDRAEIEAQLNALGERRQAILPRLVQLRDMAKRGVMLELPLTDRQIPLITDEWAKPELGSGCVKITPAHDANDYEVGQRHPEIGAINVMNPDGTLNENAPEKYRGLKMHTQAREAVIADMQAAGLYDPETDREDREIDLAHSDRSKTPIEPYLADQWFVKMDELAQSAMDAVTDGRVKIFPKRYAKGYLDWLSEKRDWPIGRQLWWGHRIPVWTIELHPTIHKRDSAIALFHELMSIAKIDRADYLLESITTNSFRVCGRTKRVAALLDAFERALDDMSSQLGDSVSLGGDVALEDASDRPRDVTFELPEFDEGVTEAANKLRLNINDLRRDPDVLDTWFSSALWPHSTLGWPEETPELKTFYPTSTLITSRDIITLWVARMVLTGLYNMGEVPFHEVYITPKILDGYGETMSKSKGNGVDPLDVIEKFGADALRFGLAYITTDTQDVKMPVEFECPHCQAMIGQTKKNRKLPRIECPECHQPFSTQWAESDDDKALPRGAVVNERFELGRNFCNKLWNAARFSLINLEGYQPGSVSDDDLLLEDRWLLSRLNTVTGEVTRALESYHYADAARTLHGFAWDEFCSFYVEMTKARFAVDESLRDSNLSSTVDESLRDSIPSFGETRQRDRQTAQRVLAHALDVLLRLLHPMIPFLTEEVWHLLAGVAPKRGLAKPQAAEESVSIAAWPEADMARRDATIEEQFADFQAVMGAVRNIRTEKNIPPKEPIQFSVRCDEATAKLLAPMRPYFESMARATSTGMGPEVQPPERAASKPVAGMEVHVDISQFFDEAAEKVRLTKARDQKAQFVASLEKKLANENFVSRAPAEVVQGQRDNLAAAQRELESIERALGKLN